ncbi:DUF2243 domain-containing protein [Adhaeribacter sp. BT258]|uniref:DUF2243 domain-containing protein n=2 Tax=Adhaeribacter terrigena TaxID=2793070 RepID=A0ABS1BXL3_9BACT|nr:DUF2243 domain-containing protein [Adhaeribacter terrigena]
MLCVSCNLNIQEGIYNENFTEIFLKTLLPLVVLIPLILLYNHSKVRNSLGDTEKPKLLKAPVIAYSLLIGIGMGGFVDGIVLHQLLQWHQMLSNQLAPVTLEAKSINMFWDGVFEAVTWILTLAGIILMWLSRKRTDLDLSNKIFIGGLIAGWGIFNVMDSANHFIFRYHNVRDNVPNPEAWNIGFLIMAILMVLIGWGIMRMNTRRT